MNSVCWNDAEANADCSHSYIISHHIWRGCRICDKHTYLAYSHARRAPATNLHIENASQTHSCSASFNTFTHWEHLQHIHIVRANLQHMYTCRGHLQHIHIVWVHLQHIYKHIHIEWVHLPHMYTCRRHLTHSHSVSFSTFTYWEHL